MFEPSELISALGPVISCFAQLQISYYVGGSVASSYHGASRSTMDVDLNAGLDEVKARAIISALREEYYVSENAVIDEIRRRSYFNLIHYATSYKIDVFVDRNRAFDQSVQKRAIRGSLGKAVPTVVNYASPEDIILLKLDWYRQGDCTSERQWADLMQVTKMQGHRLDRTYIDHWATELKVADLWKKLIIESNV